MDRKPLQLALREMQAIFTSPRSLVSMAGAVLVLGLSGPFDTYSQLNTAERLVYWFAIVVLTYSVGRGTAVFMLALLPRVTAVPVRVGFAALACSVPVTLIVIGVNLVAFGSQTSIDPIHLWAYCLAIALALVVVMTVLERPPREARTTPPTVAERPQVPAILERVPRPQRGALICLTVEDHYVAVVTDKGRSLVLMRLGDAIKETGAVTGLQIHRSHWVALDAVKRVVRADGKVAVELSTGDRLPISRSYLAAARAAGLMS